MDRRNFIKTTGSAAVCICGLSALTQSCNTIAGVSSLPEVSQAAFYVKDNEITIDISKIPSFQNENAASKLTVHHQGKKQKLLIVKLKKEFQVFADNCTHGGRELNFDPNGLRLQCSSFGHSTFDLNGQVTKGPAKEKLTEYSCELIDQKLIVAV